MDYSNATEKDLLEEIVLAQMGIAREKKRLSEVQQALAAFRAKNNGGEPKREDCPAEPRR